MLIEAMATHKDLIYKKFESNLKNQGNIAFLEISNFGLVCDERLIGSHFI